ncbi:hypothetical protein GGR52DRAFT_577723 [Hypoxylon sp. FL1284]|nr:hypothetical protein GGR52DRAFT_577723 [Hypoxylon sp. FL1284]
MADQCIVCLENLDVQSPPAQLRTSPELDSSRRSPSESDPITAVGAGALVQPPTQAPAQSSANPPLPKTANGDGNGDDPNNVIAVIEVCGHVLHDACLRVWTGTANSCPICRQAFHLVHVYDKVGGKRLSSYRVEDKKQVAEFDPQAWLDENPEIEEEETICPICTRGDHEDLLLLCDGCDSAYHTYCVELDSVPRGHWFCMECANVGTDALAEHLEDLEADPAGISNGGSGYMPRTQATVRRARRQARANDWQGAWGQITGRVYDALNLDLDNHDDDEALQNYRRSQRRRERERVEYNRWQQRLNIASRLGARDVFASHLDEVLPQFIPRPRPPPPPIETPEEKQAWGALEKAMEADKSTQSTQPATSHRKRKSRSVTASPVEPAEQPERKLKRPRTRRAPTTGEASSSNWRPAQAEPSTSTSSRPGPSASSPISPVQSNGDVPSFLSSLLKEVEMSASSDDENVRSLFSISKPVTDPSSPASSPSPSAHNSPRALSITPPPRASNDRPGSPLSLSSHIEPIYPPSNFLANRSQNGDHSDSESRSRQQTHQQNGAAKAASPEIKQPRPRRQQSARYLPRPQESSPTRGALPFEMKESITGIVKDALKPHWKSGNITADQYASINRDLSHKLYKEVSDDSLDEDARQRFEKIATKEVSRAIADLNA